MDVVGEQAVGMDALALTLERSSEDRQVSCSVMIVQKDRSTIVPALRNVTDRSRHVLPESPRHGGNISCEMRRPEN